MVLHGCLLPLLEPLSPWCGNSSLWLLAFSFTSHFNSLLLSLEVLDDPAAHACPSRTAAAMGCAVGVLGAEDAGSSFSPHVLSSASAGVKEEGDVYTLWAQNTMALLSKLGGLDIVQTDKQTGLEFFWSVL